MNLVKKAIIFLFILQVITAGQLAKIPILMNHYYEHSEKHQLNFTTFLSLHYLNYQGDGDDHDNETDQNLPFKSINHSTFQLVETLSNKVELCPAIILHEKPIFYYKAIHSIPLLDNEIKPPSIA